jgi:hypothetical protein
MFRDDLWYIARIEPGKVGAWPLRAWPLACQVHDRYEMCRDAQCVRHMTGKVQEFQERKIRELDDLYRPRPKKRRSSDSAWEAEKQQWLRERRALDAESEESERDASQIQERMPELKTELGNGSGPSEGPANA